MRMKNEKSKVPVIWFDSNFFSTFSLYSRNAKEGKINLPLLISCLALILFSENSKNCGAENSATRLCLT